MNQTQNDPIIRTYRKLLLFFPFTIYEDPIAETQSEGVARVQQVHQVIRLDTYHDLLFCSVSFEGEEHKAYYRTIKVVRPKE